MATSAEARRYQAYAARIRDAWRHGRLDAGQTRRLEAAGFEFEPRRLSGVVRIEDGRRFDTLKAAHDETGGSVGRISVAARSAQPWRRSAGGAHWIPAGRWDALGEQGRRRLRGLVEGERLRGLWVCAETGEAYDTMTLAAEAHGMPVSRLQKRNRLDRRTGASTGSTASRTGGYAAGIPACSPPGAGRCARPCCAARSYAWRRASNTGTRCAPPKPWP